MSKLTGWTAKRAGGRITINGLSAETGQPMKIVGVDQIEAGKNGMPATAVDKTGARHELA